MVKVAKKVPDATPEELVPYPEGSGPFFITDKNAEREIRLSKEGIASVPPKTVSQLCEETCKKVPDRLVFAIEWPEPPLDKTIEDPRKQAPPPKPLEEWKKWTYKDVLKELKAASLGFMSLGHEEREAVTILGFNSPFWIIGAYGAIYAGGISSGLYPTDSIEQISYKIQVSDTSIVLVDTETNYKKFADNLDDMPDVKAIVVWKDTSLVSGDTGKMIIKRTDGSEVQVVTWEKLIELGEEAKKDTEQVKQLQQRVDNQNPGMCCTIVFTSGTTGNPKAVMISHDNIYYQGLAIEYTLPDVIRVENKSKMIMLSYLPLSHIAGFTLDVIGPMIVPNYKVSPSFEIYFARSYDLKNASLLGRLLTVRPTLFFGVPRIWEKFAEALKAKAPKKGIVARMGRFAKRKMFTAEKNLQMGGTGSKPLGYGIAKGLLGKVHAKMGLDRCVMANSGAAPMKMDMLHYWSSLGFTISETYGMSESTGLAIGGNLTYRAWGSCGSTQPGTEAKVFKVDDKDFNKKTECPRARNLDDAPEECQGELCYRGRHIMLGYMANPKLGKEHMEKMKKKNAETIDAEGWLHSGDKGFITRKGVFRITGRYKEIIIGAGGENIAPVPIEDDWKARCPAISNVMMIGDGRKYNTALITLMCEGATGEKPGTDELAGPAAEMTSAKTISEAVKDAAFIKKLEDKLAETNANGKVIMNNTFKIQKFTILPHDFSVETGELTPTLKLKRSVVQKQYAEAIEAMYASKEGIYIPYAGV